MFSNIEVIFLVYLVFYVNKIQLDFVGLTVIFHLLQNVLTLSSKFCKPSGDLDISITLSAYIRHDIREPLGSSSESVLELSRSSASVFMKILK